MYSFSDMRLHRPRALARELRRIHRTADNIERASRWSRRSTGTVATHVVPIGSDIKVLSFCAVDVLHCEACAKLTVDLLGHAVDAGAQR